MIELIKELKQTMKERLISPEGASHYIGCTAKSVYRWLSEESIPTMMYRRWIKKGIRKMKREGAISDGLIKVGFRPEQFKMLLDICRMAEIGTPIEETDLIKNAKIWKNNFKLLFEKYGT